MKITELIAATGKPRSQICKEAGISPAFLSLLESGARQVGVSSLARVAEALGVEPSTLRPDLALLLSPKHSPEGADDAR